MAQLIALYLLLQHGQFIVWVQMKKALKGELHEQVLASRQNPKLFLELRQVLGSLKDSKPFADSFTTSYVNITEKRVKQCLVEMNNSISKI